MPGYTWWAVPKEGMPLLDFLRRERQALPAPPPDPRIEADLSGAVVHGPVAIGEHIVQIHADHGAVVNYLAPEKRAVPRLRRPPPRRLPRDFPGILGRDPILSAAREGLASGAPIELHGVNGIGKTSVLRHLAHRADRAEEQGVVHVSCRRMPVDDLLQFLFESFYECDQVMVPSPAQLSEYLHELRALIVLDDIGLDRQELQSVVDMAPACAFIWAAEERRLWGEGRSIALGALAHDAALALFERELGRPLQGAERRAAVAFCRAIGDPLRIVQAASLVERGEIAAQALPQFAASGGDRVEAVLAESLGERERAVVGPIAALTDGALDAELAASASRVSEGPKLLTSLEERGVVEAHSPRYTLRGRLAATLRDELEPGLGSAWLEPTLSELGDRAESAPDPGAVAGASDAILAALQAGAEVGPQAEVLRLARAADPGLVASGRWGAWGETLERALAAARELRDRGAEAWALHQLGSRALVRGETDVAQSALHGALELRERLGDADGAAITRHNLDLLHGAPPSPPGPRGRPRWLFPAAVAALVAAGLAAGAIALSGGEEEQPGERAGQTEDAVPPGQETAKAPEPAELEPDPIDLDEIVLGDTGTGTLTATNPSPERIEMGRVKPGGPGLAVTNDGCSRAVLEPGQSCTLTVSATPTDLGGYSAELTVKTVGAGAPGRVGVTGTVVSNGQTPPDDVEPPPDDVEPPPDDVEPQEQPPSVQ